MQEIALCFSILISGISISAVILFFLEQRAAIDRIKSLTKEFEALMKEASEANNSFANKMLQLEEKVDSVEFWKQTQSSSTNKR